MQSALKKTNFNCDTVKFYILLHEISLNGKPQGDKKLIVLQKLRNLILLSKESESGYFTLQQKHNNPCF